MKTTVVFIHGLWLHADSWSRWMERFRAAGYETLNPAWPGEQGSALDIRSRPERVANIGLKQLTDHHAAIIQRLPSTSILVGHSFGGLIVQKLLGMGLGSAGVAIDPAQMRGVYPLPFAQLQSVLPILGNPTNYSRAVMLTKDQFARGFANAIARDEADALYDRYVIPSPGRPLFEGALANLNPRSAANVDVNRSGRGPLLMIAGGKDRTVPEVVARAAYLRYRAAPTVNDYRVFSDRAHSLVIDHGWVEIAEYALRWLADKAPPMSVAPHMMPGTASGVQHRA